MRDPRADGAGLPSSGRPPANSAWARVVPAKLPRHGQMYSGASGMCRGSFFVASLVAGVVDPQWATGVGTVGSSCRAGRRREFPSRESSPSLIIVLVILIAIVSFADSFPAKTQNPQRLRFPLGRSGLRTLQRISRIARIPISSRQGAKLAKIAVPESFGGSSALPSALRAWRLCENIFRAHLPCLPKSEGSLYIPQFACSAKSVATSFRVLSRVP